MADAQKRNSPFGLVGVVLGVVALGAALAHFWLGPIEPPPPMENIVAEAAVKIKKAVEARLRGESSKTEVQPRAFSKDDIARAGTIGTAFLAIILAVVSFIRREDLRVGGSAAALGAGAIAFQFLAIALMAIVAVILIGAVLNAIGISP